MTEATEGVQSRTRPLFAEIVAEHSRRYHNDLLLQVNARQPVPVTYVESKHSNSIRFHKVCSNQNLTLNVIQVVNIKRIILCIEIHSIRINIQ